ncbi:MAG: nucleotide exchange factor GrpE [Deltaproteobacteria bacterium]|nr:nucleotide exchange factor GrpE [Deltaproteobacteria bacterium]
MDEVTNEPKIEAKKKPEAEGVPAIKPDPATQPAAVEEDYKKKCEEAQKEAKENYNKWLYLYADFENYKKRVHKEKLDLLKYGNESLAYELLEVVDSLEKALSHTDEKNGAKGLEGGIRLTMKQFLSVLEKFGIKPIQSVGTKFDPKFHEAVGEEEKEDHGPGMVVRETQKGYVLHERLLRAARVIVAKKKEQK